MKNFQITLLSFLFLCLFITSCSSEDDGIYFDQQNEVAISYSNIELEILDLVNEYRVANGLNVLEKMNVISNVAKTHTVYMAETGKVCHDNFAERHQKLVSTAQAKIVGENVGYGFTTAEGVVNAWLNSDEHRKLIEKTEYTHFGISTKKSVDGRNYFTQIFIER